MLINRRWQWCATALFVASGSFGCAAGASARGPADVAVPTQEVDELTISPYGDDELAEQFEQAQRLLLDDQAAEAAERFDQLVRFSPRGRTAAPSLFNAGVAYTAMGDRTTAVERLSRHLTEFPGAPTEKAALIRSVRLLAHLERWEELSALSKRLLAHGDLATLEKSRPWVRLRLVSSSWGGPELRFPTFARRAI